MAPDATAAIDASSAEVMASIDTDTRESQFVIADVTRDDAWVSILLEEAASLPDWR